MNPKLKLKNGIEVWVNKKIEKECEEVFKEYLKDEELNYYYVDRESGKTKWLGKMSLIEYFKLMQRTNKKSVALGVTNAKNKKQLEKWFEMKFLDNQSEVFDYWISDIYKNNVIAGDDLTTELWYRILNKKTAIKK